MEECGRKGEVEKNQDTLCTSTNSHREYIHYVSQICSNKNFKIKNNAQFPKETNISKPRTTIYNKRQIAKSKNLQR